jgi:hypothetical protein
MDPIWPGITLKWVSIVFVRLVLSQRKVTVSFGNAPLLSCTNQPWLVSWFRIPWSRGHRSNRFRGIKSGGTVPIVGETVPSPAKRREDLLKVENEIYFQRKYWICFR